MAEIRDTKMPRSKQHSMSAAPGGKIAGKKHPGKAILAGKANIYIMMKLFSCIQHPCHTVIHTRSKSIVRNFILLPGYVIQ